MIMEKRVIINYMIIHLCILLIFKILHQEDVALNNVLKMDKHLNVVIIKQK
jgi:hypothetical protein